MLRFPLRTSLMFFGSIVTIALVSVVLIIGSIRLDHYFLKKQDSSAIGYYLSAKKALRDYDIDHAASLFEKALKREPANPVILEYTYQSLVLSGNIKKAIRLAQKYTQGIPGNITGNLILAIDAIRHNQFNKAEQVLIQKTANTTAVDIMVTPFLLVWLKVAQGKFAIAQEMLQSISTTYPEYQQFIIYQTALIYDLQGDMKNAEKYYVKMLPKAGRSYRFIHAAGNFYERIGNKAKALEIYRQFPTHDSLSQMFNDDIERITAEKSLPHRWVSNAREGIIEVLFEIAGGLFKGKMFAESQAYLQMILYLNPSAEQALFLLASFYDQEKLFDKAIHFYNEIPKESDFYYQSRISAAQSAYKAEKISQSIRILKELSSRYSQQKEALFLLAEILNQKGDYLESSFYCDKILALYAQNQEPIDWQVLFLRGINADKSEQWDQAEADFLQILQLHPEQPEVLNYLGYSWILQKKNTEKAYEMIEQALLQSPDDPHILDSMGWALFHQEKFKEALTYLERAVTLMPADPTINEHLGDIYWKLHRKLEASFQWNHALSLASPDQNTEELEKKIASGLD